MAGFSPERTAADWAACKASLRTYWRVIKVAALVIALGMAWGMGVLQSPDTCPPGPPPAQGPPSPHPRK